MPPLSYGKKLAIQSLNYVGSVKVALVFTRYKVGTRVHFDM